MYKNINNIIDLYLVKGEICCKNCNYSWKGYSNGSARGHIIFNKEDRFVFVPDDIWYGFPLGTNFNIETIFEKRGWLSIYRCPIYCFGHNEIKSDFNMVRKAEKIECYEIISSDFECLDGVWILSPKSIVRKNI